MSVGSRDTGTEIRPQAPRAVFTVEDIPRHERFEVWKESIACIFDVDADQATRREDFHAAVDASMIGPLMLARTQSRGQLWSRSPSTIARDGMDHVMIQLYEAGDQRVVTEGREIDQPPDGLLVYDLSRSIAARSGSFTNLSLILPRDALADRVGRLDDLHMLRLEEADPLVVMLREHMRALKRLTSELTVQQCEVLTETTIALAAGCLNACAGQNGLPASDKTTIALFVARRLIDANLSDENLGPDWLTRRLGMSRAKLYRLFAPFGGISHYITARRLRRALQDLRDHRDRSIYEVAVRAGFSNETTFGRAFRQRYGITPRDARHAAAPRPGSPRATGLDRRYEDWLLHLAH